MGNIVNRIYLPTFSVLQMCMFCVTSHVCVHECYSQDPSVFLKSGNPASISPLLRLASLYVGSEYQIKTWAFQARISPLVLYICFNKFIK